ncbi:MAG: outer membrane beta-barrel protein [Parvibaculaceae bacterium]
MTVAKKIFVPLLAAGALFAGAASAEENRGEGVLDRARPDYDPAGIRVGSFLLFPSVELGVGYDDNVGRSTNNTTDSYELTIAPQLQFQSQWSRHELNFGLAADAIFYEADSDLDYTNYGADIEGRLDISNSTNVEAYASYEELNEEIRSTTAPLAASEPTEYNAWGGGLQLNQRFNRLTAELEGTYEQLDYDDVRANGGVVIDNDNRDRDVVTGRLRLGYDVDPDVNLFIEGALNEVDYDQAPPTVAVNRDSDGYRLGVGAEFDLTTLVSGEVVVGYLEQDYDSQALADVDGLAADVGVNWYLTPLTTVRLGAGSSAQQSDTTGSGGYLSQSIELAVDHELLRNVIISVGGDFENNDFEGINRDEDIVGFGLNAQYLINRNMAVDAGYRYEERDSNVVGRDYDRNQIGVTLRLQM